jgi:hypothetical protein
VIPPSTLMPKARNPGAPDRRVILSIARLLAKTDTPPPMSLVQFLPACVDTVRKWRESENERPKRESLAKRLDTIYAYAKHLARELEDIEVAGLLVQAKARGKSVKMPPPDPEAEAEAKRRAGVFAEVEAIAAKVVASCSEDSDSARERSPVERQIALPNQKAIQQPGIDLGVRLEEALIPSFGSFEVYLYDLLAEIAARAEIACKPLRGAGANRARQMRLGKVPKNEPLSAKEFTALIVIEAWLAVHEKEPPVQTTSKNGRRAHEAAAALWQASGGTDDGKEWRHAFAKAKAVPYPEELDSEENNDEDLPNIQASWRGFLRRRFQDAARPQAATHS